MGDEQVSSVGPRASGEATVHAVPPESLDRLLNKYDDVFKSELPGLPPERDVPQVIQLEPGAKPANRPMYRYPPAEVEEMHKQVTDLLKKGLIRPSCSRLVPQYCL